MKRQAIASTSAKRSGDSVGRHVPSTHDRSVGLGSAAVAPAMGGGLGWMDMPQVGSPLPSACACGGGCPACRGRLVSRPSDAAERAAAGAAAAATRSIAGGQSGHADARSVAPSTIRRPVSGSARFDELPGFVTNVLRDTGRPLESRTREQLGVRMGADFAPVRVHTGSEAAASARALHAKAYTIGSDIVFNEGAYQPGTATGRSLLAHELAHTLQPSGTGGPAIHRQPDPNAPSEEPSAPPGFSLPGGLTLFPGPERLFNLLGAPIPLPGSARLTNALGTGPGPSFVLDVAPERLVLTLLGSVDLSAGPLPGTSEASRNDPNLQSRVSLLTPILRLDPATGRLVGTATLRVPSGYPLNLHAPTDLDVRIESTQLGGFTGRIGYGPLHADMNLQLHYDTGRLETAVRPAFAPAGGFAGFADRLAGILRELVPGIQLSGVLDSLSAVANAVSNGSLPVGQFAERVISLIASSIPEGFDLASLRTALTNLANEITHPGFSLRGTLGLGPLPLSTFSAYAPTTVPLARPLFGAPAPFPLTYSAGGVILAPPGAITDITVPAFGYTYSSFGATSGTSFTAAALPTLSPTAISAGRPFAEQFPVYVYAELSHVRRVSSSLDLGVRLTAQFSTPELAGSAAAPTGDANAQFQQALQQYQEANNPSQPAKPPVPNIGVTFFGRF
jgi:hypothetical protein